MGNSNSIKKLLREALIREGYEDVLYHGTHIKNLADIQSYGLLPDFGDVVKSTEMYGYYMDDEYVDLDDKVEGILFFSEDPDTWRYSHYGKTPNIDEAVLVVIQNNDTIYRNLGNGNFVDWQGNDVGGAIDYIDVDRLPGFIETGDSFSFQEQEPIDILFGDRLKQFINGK